MTGSGSLNYCKRKYGTIIIDYWIYLRYEQEHSADKIIEV